MNLAHNILLISALLVTIFGTGWYWVDSFKINNLKKEKLKLEIEIIKQLDNGN